jgi:hypothetical protein
LRSAAEVSRNLTYPYTQRYPTPNPANNENYGPKNREKIPMRTTGYHLEGIWIGKQHNPLGISGYYMHWMTRSHIRIGQRPIVGISMTDGKANIPKIILTKL